jgi:hypothetical protein
MSEVAKNKISKFGILIPSQNCNKSSIKPRHMMLPARPIYKVKYKNGPKSLAASFLSPAANDLLRWGKRTKPADAVRNVEPETIAIMLFRIASILISPRLDSNHGSTIVKRAPHARVRSLGDPYDSRPFKSRENRSLVKALNDGFLIDRNTRKSKAVVVNENNPKNVTTSTSLNFPPPIRQIVGTIAIEITLIPLEILNSRKPRRTPLINRKKLYARRREQNGTTHETRLIVPNSNCAAVPLNRRQEPAERISRNTPERMLVKAMAHFEALSSVKLTHRAVASGNTMRIIHSRAPLALETIEYDERASIPHW